MNFYDINNLKKYNEIVFGPSLMEMGWELFRWAPFIRWYKKENKHKKIHVLTRKDRMDLYYDNVDTIIPLTIDGDYIDYRPNMYQLNFFPREKYNQLISRYKKLFKNAFIFEPPNTNNRNFFNPNNMDFSLNTNPENKRIIDSYLIKNKIPIVISPRHRVDMKIKQDRNWKLEYWHQLFDMIESSNKFITFIAGSDPSFVKPKSKAFIVLEHLTSFTASNIGLTIEAIKSSKLVIGNQSAIPVLANHLKTPTLFWGHEQQRHQVLENPLNTPCTFISESTQNYCTHPNIIFDNIESLTRSL